MTESLKAKIAELEQAIIIQEEHRSTLGDIAVDAAIDALRQQLDNLKTQVISPQQQRKQVTVLFADVSGFTAMSETMDAEEVSETMNALWAQLDAVILERGGLIDKHIGDAVMALWGTETAREDDPHRATRAALAMQRTLKEFVGVHDKIPSLQMRIGLNTGPVLLGKVGTTGEFTAMGDTVNVASRLEHAAPIGGVLISQATYRHVQGSFETEKLDPIAVKGKTEPLQVYAVTVHKEPVFHVQLRGIEGIETQMIGREAEFARLQDVLQQVLAKGQAQLVTIVGEAGVGKSRLLYEFESWLNREFDTISVMKGRANPEMQNTPYSLLRDMFRFRFDIRDSDSAETVLAKFRQGMAGYLPSERADLVGHLVGFDFSSSQAVANLLSSESFTQLATANLLDYLRAILADAPGAIFLEDVHWADDVSLSLLAHIMKEISDGPLLILCLARPSLYRRHPDWSERHPAHIRLDLQSLTEQDCRALVTDILQKVPDLPDDVCAAITHNAEGNPFYVEELIKMLIDNSVIVCGAEMWRIEKKLSEMDVPSTLTGILQARLDRLSPVEREVLQRASVVGRQFWDAIIGQLGETSQMLNVTSLLDTIENRELIFRQDNSSFEGVNEYFFKHAMVRDVTYETVLLKLRRVYHAQVAQWLEGNAGERIGEYLNLIATHYELAGELEKAVTYLRRSGQELLQTNTYRDAISVFERALSLIPENDVASQVTLQILLSEAHIGLGNMAEAEEILTKSLPLARQHGNVLQVAEMLRNFGQVSNVLGNLPEGRSALEEAVDIARHEDKPADLAKALILLGHLLTDIDEMETARGLLEEALEIGTVIEDHQITHHVLHNLGMTVFEIGEREQGIKYLEAGISVAHEIGDRIAIAASQNRLAHYLNIVGDFAAANKHIHAAIQTYEEVGDRFQTGITVCTLGQINFEIDNYSEARKHLYRSLRLFVEVGSVTFQLALVSMFGGLQAKEGNIQQGLAWIGLALYHPATTMPTHTYWEPYLEEFKAEFGEEAVSAYLERGKTLDLDEVVMEILQEEAGKVVD